MSVSRVAAISSSIDAPVVSGGWRTSRSTPASAYRRASASSIGPGGEGVTVTSSCAPSSSRTAATCSGVRSQPYQAVGRAGAAVGGRRFAADHDRRMRALDRARPLDHVRERDEAPLELRRRLVPQRAHGGNVLIGARAAVGQRRAERAQFGLEIADAEADDQSALAEHVDRRQLLGEQDRLALRQHDHPDREPHALRHGGEVRQRDDRLQPVEPNFTLSSVIAAQERTLRCSASG
jgi:hypothetical protein